MVTFVKGDMFKSPSQVLTNAVNCVGIMGKGIALEFKNRYPTMFTDYQNRCTQGDVKPGVPYLWEDDASQILNFPTKRHWKDNSTLQDIDDGLKYLAESYKDMGIQSISTPALGCGLGGLNWQDVQSLFEKHLGPIADLDVYVYVPQNIVLMEDFNSNKDHTDLAPTDKISAQPQQV